MVENQSEEIIVLLQQMVELEYRLPRNYSKYISELIPEAKEELIKLKEYFWPVDEQIKRALTILVLFIVKKGYSSAKKWHRIQIS